ncbi:inovirus-type Gp2 protein, partial [Providencia rettgeri]
MPLSKCPHLLKHNSFQRTDERAITRFIESLKSQLRAAHHRTGRSGTPALPYYAWVRER